MTKVELERELHNTQLALKEVLDYAFLVAIASEHFAYALLLEDGGEVDLARQNAFFALDKVKESYDLMPSQEWADKIGYLWEIAHTGKIQ